MEAAGVGGLQPVLVVEGEADQPQGMALGMGAVGEGLQGGGGVPLPHGPEVGVAQGAVQPDQQPPVQGGVLKAVGVLPTEEDGKTVITKGQPLAFQDGADPGDVTDVGGLKRDHKTSFAVWRL